MLRIKTIVVDLTGPEEGAVLINKYILVQEKNKEKLLEALKLFIPDVTFTIMTKEEFDNGEYCSSKKS